MSVVKIDSEIHDPSQEPALAKITPDYSAFSGLVERADFWSSLLKCNVSVIALVVTQIALGAVGWSSGGDISRMSIAGMMLLFGSAVFFFGRSDNASTGQNRTQQPP